MTKLPFTSFTISPCLPPQARAPFRPFPCGEAYNVVSTPYSVEQRQTGWSQAVVDLYVFLASWGGGKRPKSEDPCRKNLWMGLLFSQRESSPSSEMQGRVRCTVVDSCTYFVWMGATVVHGERCMYFPIFCWMRWFYIHTCCIWFCPPILFLPLLCFLFFSFLFPGYEEMNLDSWYYWNLLILLKFWWWVLWVMKLWKGIGSFFFFWLLYMLRIFWIGWCWAE